MKRRERVAHEKTKLQTATFQPRFDIGHCMGGADARIMQRV